MLWDSVSFEEACTMHHTKNFIEICFNNQCDRLVSCGFETTKIWSIPSGQLLASVQNLAESKALTIAFAENDSRVIIGSDDSIVRYLHLSALDGCWHSLDTTLLQEKSPVEGCSLNCPSSKAFNKDITQIALAYRGYPLLLRSTNKPRLLGRCRRVVRDSPDHASLLVGWITAKRVVCKPIADDLVGLVTNGSVFKWNPRATQLKRHTRSPTRFKSARTASFLLQVTATVLSRSGVSLTLVLPISYLPKIRSLVWDLVPIANVSMISEARRSRLGSLTPSFGFSTTRRPQATQQVISKH